MINRITKILKDFKDRINWIFAIPYIVLFNMVALLDPYTLTKFLEINGFLFGVLVLAYIMNKLNAPHP